MLNYVLRRLALMVPTLLGILLVSFIIIQFVPGGPVEQLVHQLQATSQGGRWWCAGSQRLSRSSGAGQGADCRDRGLLWL